MLRSLYHIWRRMCRKICFRGGGSLVGTHRLNVATIDKFND